MSKQEKKKVKMFFHGIKYLISECNLKRNQKEHSHFLRFFGVTFITIKPEKYKYRKPNPYLFGKFQV